MPSFRVQVFSQHIFIPSHVPPKKTGIQGSKNALVALLHSVAQASAKTGTSRSYGHRSKESWRGKTLGRKGREALFARVPSSDFQVHHKNAPLTILRLFSFVLTEKRSA